MSIINEAVNEVVAAVDSVAYVVSPVHVAGGKSCVEALQVIGTVEVPNTLFCPADIAYSYGIDVDQVKMLIHRIKYWWKNLRTKGYRERDHHLRVNVVQQFRDCDLDVLMALRLYGERKGELSYEECYDQAHGVFDLADTIRNSPTLGMEIEAGLTLLCGNLSAVDDGSPETHHEAAVKSPPIKGKSKAKSKRWTAPARFTYRATAAQLQYLRK